MDCDFPKHSVNVVLEDGKLPSVKKPCAVP
uniref:Uncharacterized protein n=1 Tax=Anguilla anguilla TaxID=7936 RepID=A0A0E9VPX0_ANGAN